MSNAVVCSATTQLAERLAIALAPGLGPTKARQLVGHFGSARFVNGTGGHPKPCCLCPMVSHWVIQPSLAREEIASAAPAGVTMLSMDDASPPPCLKEIYDPPLITRVRGNPEVLTKPGIAMVGTRPPTPTELAWPSGGHAIWPPKDWSLLILVFVMSGLAGGVDTASHRGAISAKGKTVGVFGTGVDLIYRQENSPLSEQILAVGSALISEFPRGTFAPSQNFPIRNRIIRGMSVGVVVVEAAEYPPRASPQAVRSNKIATCLRCPATSPTEIPGDRTPSSNRAPCWWRPGKT